MNQNSWINSYRVIFLFQRLGNKNGLDVDVDYIIMWLFDYPWKLSILDISYISILLLFFFYLTKNITWKAPILENNFYHFKKIIDIIILI